MQLRQQVERTGVELLNLFTLWSFVTLLWTSSV